MLSAAPKEEAVRKERESRLKIRASRDGFSVRLSGGTVPWACEPAHRRELVDRLFSVPDVMGIALRLEKGEVRVEMREEIADLAEMVGVLGGAMNAPRVPRQTLCHEHWLDEPMDRREIEIWRLGTELTFWRISNLGNGHFRLEHPIFNKKPELKKEVRFALGALPRVSVLPPRIFFDHVEVRVRGLEVDEVGLLDVADPVLIEEGPLLGRKRVGHHPRSVHRVVTAHHDKLINANLAVAPFADLLFPPLGIINLVLVWLINRVHINPAWDDLKRGRTNLHLLYFTIGAFTLLSYSFLAAAVMYWFLSFWRKQTLLLREHFESDFLSRYRRYPRRVWVEMGEASVQTRLADLQPENVVLLKAGDYIPGDGIVLSGNATVEEYWLTGGQGPMVKGTGERIYQSAEVLEGNLRVQLSGRGRTDTVAQAIASWYENEWQRRHVETANPGHEYATKAVLPVMLLGLVALSRDGILVAKATLRPDFCSGPESATDLMDLAGAMGAVEEGLLIAASSSVECLLDVDCLILDDSAPWFSSREGGTNQDEGRFVKALKDYGVREVIFLGDKLDRVGVELGCDFVQRGYSDEAKAAFIEQRQSFSDRIAYVGDCVANPRTAREADCAISVVQVPRVYPLANYPSILTPDLEKILRLYAIAQTARDNFSTTTRITLVPNLVAIFSTMYLGTHINTTVAITNIGSAVNFVRGAGALEMSR